MKKQQSTTKRHIKKGDVVKVIAGNSKNKIGKVLSVLPSKNSAVVENTNLRTFHIKPTQQQKGRREKKEAPIHLSNLMLLDPNTEQPTRIGRRHNEQNKLQRYAKKTDQFI